MQFSRQLVSVIRIDENVPKASVGGHEELPTRSYDAEVIADFWLCKARTSEAGKLPDDAAFAGKTVQARQGPNRLPPDIRGI